VFVNQVNVMIGVSFNCARPLSTSGVPDPRRAASRGRAARRGALRRLRDGVLFLGGRGGRRWAILPSRASAALGRRRVAGARGRRCLWPWCDARERVGGVGGELGDDLGRGTRCADQAGALSGVERQGLNVAGGAGRRRCRVVAADGATVGRRCQHVALAGPPGSGGSSGALPRLEGAVAQHAVWGARPAPVKDRGVLRVGLARRADATRQWAWTAASSASRKRVPTHAASAPSARTDARPRPSATPPAAITGTGWTASTTLGTSTSEATCPRTRPRPVAGARTPDCRRPRNGPGCIRR